MRFCIVPSCRPFCGHINSSRMSGNGCSWPRGRHLKIGWTACKLKPVRNSRRTSLHFTRAWRFMAATANRARDVVTRSCEFATPTTRRTIAPDARLVESFSPIALYLGCSDQIGRALWKNWRHSSGVSTLLPWRPLIGRD
jgi:hypothetical protein